MSKGPYTPQPGTIPAKVITYLQTLPPGTFVSTAVLSEQLDIELYSVASSLARPRSLGMVMSRHTVDNKRALEWAIGDGVPLPPPDDHEPEEPLHTNSSHVPRRTPIALPTLAPTEPSSDAEPEYFRAGIFTDGTLHIVCGDTTLILNPQHTAKVARLFTQGINP